MLSGTPARFTGKPYPGSLTLSPFSEDHMGSTTYDQPGGLRTLTIGGRTR